MPALIPQIGHTRLVPVVSTAAAAIRPSSLLAAAVAAPVTAAAAPSPPSVSTASRFSSLSTPRPTRPSPSLAPSSTTPSPYKTSSSPRPFAARPLPPQTQTQTPTHMSFLTKFFSSSAPTEEAMAKASEKVQQAIDANSVVVFSKSWCSFSRATKQTLKSTGADFQVIELDQESDGDEMQDALEQISGQRTVPNVYIAKKHIGGNSDLQGLKSRGQLVKLLKSAGAVAE